MLLYDVCAKVEELRVKEERTCLKISKARHNLDLEYESWVKGDSFLADTLSAMKKTLLRLGAHEKKIGEEIEKVKEDSIQLLPRCCECNMPVLPWKHDGRWYRVCRNHVEEAFDDAYNDWAPEPNQAEIYADFYARGEKDLVMIDARFAPPSSKHTE
jgi:hypothetical protein